MAEPDQWHAAERQGCDYFITQTSHESTYPKVSLSLHFTVRFFASLFCSVSLTKNF